MSTFYNSKINTTIRKLTNLTAMQAVAYTTQVNDVLNLEKIRVISIDNSKKDRLSQMGRSTYGPQKLTRKK